MIEAIKYQCIPICVNGGYHKYIINNDINGILVNNRQQLELVIKNILTNQHKLDINKTITYNNNLITNFTLPNFYNKLSNIINK